jgi:cytochrome c oxidase assembly factor CtaG
MVVLAACLVVGAAYARGTITLWQHAGHGRGVKSWQVACFGIALLATVAALESPLDALAASAFTAHMVQHLVLILVVAPLTVLGAPLAAIAWALPPASRPRLSALRPLRRLATMPTAFVLHSLALWAWHLPRLYDAAIQQPTVHVLEHACFLVTAVCFWWAVLGSSYLTGVL